MLRLTIELVPRGNEACKRVLGVIHIANVDVTVSNMGTYSVVEMNSERKCFKWTGIADRIGTFGDIGKFLRRLFANRADDLPVIEV